MKILIPIETSIRELTYKVYLSRSLSKKGFQCYLGNKSSINYLTTIFKNYIYLDKGYHKGVSEKIYERVKKNNGIVISLDEEGAVDFSNNSTLSKRYSQALIDNCKLIFLWGIKQHELIKKSRNNINNLIVSGHPRFELLKPKFHFLYSKRSQDIKNKYGNFILINTNMGFGNNLRGDDFVVSNYKDRFSNIKSLIEYDKKKLNNLITLINKISIEINKTIIIRPHPEEDLSFYKNIYKNNIKVKIINEDSVVPWIIAADSVIHPDCTTAIEAYIIGEEPISYLPKESSTFVTELPLQISRCFTDCEKAITFIKSKNHKKNRIINSQKIKKLEDSFSFQKDTMKIFEENILGLRSKNPSKITRGISFFNKIYLKNLSFRTSIAINKSAKLYKKKIDGLNLKRILNIINQVDADQSDKQEINVSQISKYLFHIYK